MLIEDIIIDNINNKIYINKILLKKRNKLNFKMLMKLINKNFVW